MLANLLRPSWNKFVQGFGMLSARIGITPDMWTLFSLVMAIFSAYLLAKGHLWSGLVLSFFMLMADAFDGATARALGSSSTFGMILDHVVDRYAEFIIFSGLLLGKWFSSSAVLFAISGMLMASYVRAKAESTCDIKACTVGMAGRVEKLLLTYGAIALLAINLDTFAEMTVWGIGLISHITAIQRLFYARSQLSKLKSTTTIIVNNP